MKQKNLKKRLGKMLEEIYKYKYELATSIGLATFGFYVMRLRRAKNAWTVLNTTTLSTERMNGKTVVITGANTGIGYETALELAKRGARVILACRDIHKASQAVERIKRATKNEHVSSEYLDLASLDSVAEFATMFAHTYSTRLDVLVNNAGVMACPKITTRDGFDYQFQVNYLSHYLLTRLLLPTLCNTATTISSPTRVINLTSKLYESGRIDWNDLNLEKSYEGTQAYRQSKLCNILFTNQLQKHFEQTSAAADVRVYSVSPGIVLTELGRHIVKSGWLIQLLSIVFYPIVWAMLRSPKQGSECSIYCAVASDLKPSKGVYFRNCQETRLLPHACDETDAQRLWDLSEKLLDKYIN